MEFEKAKALLTKYWQAETTLEEEQWLREFFRNETCTGELGDAKALFQYFETQQSRTMKEVPLMNPMKRRKPSPWIFNSMRIAAGIAVLCLAIWFIRGEVRSTTPPELVDTYDNPELAFEETKKALLMISRSFGEAEKEARKINLFNEAKERIQNSTSKETEK